ncbi:hypothetical protein HS125_02465 [bacterium]|nr:hypothetical protein [bacterium]
MPALIDFLSNHAIFTLFVILSLGVLVGELGIRGVSLGTSGVFFVALLFGHYGVTVSPEIETLGVVLFVYSIGLSAGPRFFKTFQKRALMFAWLAVATITAGFAAAAVVEAAFHFGPALSTGVFTGALTSTPGLAAAQESLSDPHVAVGYGIAYPFGVVGVVLFVQVLPRLLRVNLRHEEQRGPAHLRLPSLANAWFEIRNPQVAGKTVDQFTSMHLLDFTLSRISRGASVTPARSDEMLHVGDHVRVVGTPENLDKLELLLGPRVPDMQEPPSNVASRTLVVTEKSVAGKRLDELQIRERFGVVVTRLWRDDIELVPKADSTLEIGDTIRIVGDAADCDRLAPLLGQSDQKQHETAFLPILLGLMLGAFLGLVPFQLGGVNVKLGMAGGPLLVGLLLGHFGRIGKMRARMPLAAKYFIREMGLILFLAGSGTAAGSQFVAVFREYGPPLLLAGATVTILPMLVAVVLARRCFRLDMLSTLGAVCGGMTCTPGLGALRNLTDSETPAITYATVYPVALIFVTVAAQLLTMLLPLLSP